MYVTFSRAHAYTFVICDSSTYHMRNMIFPVNIKAIEILCLIDKGGLEL